MIGIAVFSVMFYAMFKHRKSKGAVAFQFDENVKAMAWTIIPFLILALMAVPATKTLLAMENTDDAALTIRVTGSSGSGIMNILIMMCAFTVFYLHRAKNGESQRVSIIFGS